MAESDSCLDETGLSATDVMLAKFTLSPCHAGRGGAGRGGAGRGGAGRGGAGRGGAGRGGAEQSRAGHVTGVSR